jgi:hypothetical protein
MKLEVPQYSDRSWQFYLGYAGCLLSESGSIKKLGVRHFRAILAVAYEVAFARRLAVGLANHDFNFRWRLSNLEFERRTQSIPLYKLDTFSYQPDFDVSVNPALEQFVRAIPEERLKLLLSWSGPAVGVVPDSGEIKVFTAQLIVAMARHRLPTFAQPLKTLTPLPPRQLSVSQTCHLILEVFDGFVANNSELICCLSETADEAALLTGLSRSRAGEIRQALGAIEL